MATDLDAPITAVTVFRDGARVVRARVLDLAAGLQSVVVRGLPASVDPASVRVAIRGRDAALLEVEVDRGYGPDPVRAEVVRLRSEAESCRDAVQALADEDTAEQARLGFADHLSEAAATALARAVGSGRAGRDELDQMAGHLAATTASALERRRGIAARTRAAERELRAAEQRLADAEQRAGAAEFTQVTAAIEATAATSIEVELAYHVPGASWQPLYDLGLAGELLTVSYLAQVIQRTGEDWPAVPLVLSTTRRGRHSGLPELEPWYISRRPAEPPPGLRHAMAMSAGGGAQEQAVPAAIRAAARPVMAPAAPMAAEVGESAAGQFYRVPRPLAVPADGNPHKTTISRFDLEAAVDHLAVPVLAPEAYLRATVTNTSPLLLLAGPARIFMTASSPARPRCRPSPPARNSSCSSGSTSRSGSSGSCTAGPRARRCSGAPARSTSRMRRRSRTTAAARPGSACATTSRSPPTRRSRSGCGRRARARPARPTWASSPGSSPCRPGSRRRSGTGSPSSIRPRSRSQACSPAATSGQRARSGAPRAWTPPG